jgi:hypothetical protein
MNVRLIPSLEKDPILLAHCKRPAGQWVLWRSALRVGREGWQSPHLALTTAFTTGAWIRLQHRGRRALPSWVDLPFLEHVAAQEGLANVPGFVIRLVVAAVFVLLAGLAALAFRFPRQLVTRRPVLATILCFCALVAAVSLAPLTGWSRVAAWIAVLAIARMLWFIRRSPPGSGNHRDSVPLQAGLWRPAWMANTASGTPFAKGAAYLRKIEAQNPDELAVTQLKGLKLLVWALILQMALICYHLVIYRKLGIPEFESAFGRSCAGHPFPWYWNCLSLVAVFFSNLLQASIWGHQIVACARMAGFRALRNTYRPLESRSLAEFWNRFYFYFKELLVDMFFYPTYLRYFKKHPRLRMAAATMMAACVGNAIFHFLRDISVVGELGWWRAIASFQTYLFYTFVLGVSISISQLRAQRKDDRSHSWLRRRLVPILCVSAFYCVMRVFDDSNRTYGLREHFIFVGRLFGL